MYCKKWIKWGKPASTHPSIVNKRIYIHSLQLHDYQNRVLQNDSKQPVFVKLEKNMILHKKQELVLEWWVQIPRIVRSPFVFMRAHLCFSDYFNSLFWNGPVFRGPQRVNMSTTISTPQWWGTFGVFPFKCSSFRRVWVRFRAAVVLDTMYQQMYWPKDSDAVFCSF